MKAIVIDDTPGEDNLCPPFKTGETVTITGIELLGSGRVRNVSDNSTVSNELAVIVDEYSFMLPDVIMVFKRSRFAPLSDQENIQLTEEEAQAIRERQKQLV